MWDAQFIAFCAGLPNVFCKKMKRSGRWRIFYKPNFYYAHSWDIWNHIKFMYETMFSKSLTTDEVKLRVYEKYIEIF